VIFDEQAVSMYNPKAPRVNLVPRERTPMQRIDDYF